VISPDVPKLRRVRYAVCTNDEIIFIINYDIKYHMGQSDGDED